ncbi:hypothetical protein [Paracoccus saliphilus]|uniref:Uncharacterized protein n=1 Tax=Paracoccus saliphilus TaxID=405559 RepID=A0AA45W6I9_9RHOB|nr:hypothetical protein [Paracoccus saliphilus]WCR04380.1 hypothetical protein JHX88_06525 [Paracoccus saliphilus]SIT02119.1 hypothetical protein SAMN05421772_112142 [Paracoccus saliphilus]
MATSPFSTPCNQVSSEAQEPARIKSERLESILAGLAAELAQSNHEVSEALDRAIASISATRKQLDGIVPKTQKNTAQAGFVSPDDDFKPFFGRMWHEE